MQKVVLVGGIDAVNIVGIDDGVDNARSDMTELTDVEQRIDQAERKLVADLIEVQHLPLRQQVSCRIKLSVRQVEPLQAVVAVEYVEGVVLDQQLCRLDRPHGRIDEGDLSPTANIIPPDAIKPPRQIQGSAVHFEVVIRYRGIDPEQQVKVGNGSGIENV